MHMAILALLVIAKFTTKGIFRTGFIYAEFVGWLVAQLAQGAFE